MNPYYILLAIISTLLFSCNEKKKEEKKEIVQEIVQSVYHPKCDIKDSCNGTEFDVLDIEIIELPLSERPYVTSLNNRVVPNKTDDNKILIHEYNGKPDYHPVAMSAYALSLLDIYRQEGQDSCLNLAIKHANKLLGISIEIDSIRLFPYSFNYKFFDRDLMIAPWYSGMAQGKALSLFSRLYEITGEKKYLNVASQIFKSFTHLKSTDPLWVSCVDDNRNLWFEEYPFDAPSHVFNGMIFAIYGVYDFYMINKTEEVSILLRGSISTIKKNMHLIRDNNEISYYCAKYNVKNPHYHPIHIGQLSMLNKITGLNEFQVMSEQMMNDGKVE